MTSKNDVAVSRNENTALMKNPDPVTTIAPLTDIFETADAYVLMLDMPGARKEDMSITVDKSHLVIRAGIEAYVKEGAKVLYSEIPGAAFRREFNLSDGVDRNNVDAHYENGVLTVKLFKKEEVKPKEIKIM